MRCVGFSFLIFDRQKYKQGDIIDAAKDGKVHGLEKCLELKADVNETDPNGYTPLLWAIQRGHRYAADFLISRKANVNHKSHNGETALYFAVQAGDAGMHVSSALIKAGADKTMKVDGTKTAVEWAMECECE